MKSHRKTFFVALIGLISAVANAEQPSQVSTQDSVAIYFNTKIGSSKHRNFLIGLHDVESWYEKKVYGTAGTSTIDNYFIRNHIENRLNYSIPGGSGSHLALQMATSVIPIIGPRIYDAFGGSPQAENAPALSNWAPIRAGQFVERLENDAKNDPAARFVLSVIKEEVFKDLDISLRQVKNKGAQQLQLTADQRKKLHDFLRETQLEKPDGELSRDPQGFQQLAIDNGMIPEDAAPEYRVDEAQNRRDVVQDAAMINGLFSNMSIIIAHGGDRELADTVANLGPLFAAGHALSQPNAALTLATANIYLAGFTALITIVSSQESGPNEQEILMDALQSLSRQIDEGFRGLHQRLGMLQDQIGLLASDVNFSFGQVLQELRDSENRQQLALTKLAAIDAKMRIAIAGPPELLRQSMNELCIDARGNFTPEFEITSMSDTLFRRCLALIKQFGTNFATFTGPFGNSIEISADSIGLFPFASRLIQLSPTGKVHPRSWYVQSEVLTTLIDKYPQFANAQNLEPKALGDLISEGEALKIFYREFLIDTDKSSGKKKVRSSQLKQLAEGYEKSAIAFLNVVNQEAQKQWPGGRVSLAATLDLPLTDENLLGIRLKRSGVSVCSEDEANLSIESKEDRLKYKLDLKKMKVTSTTNRTNLIPETSVSKFGGFKLSVDDLRWLFSNRELRAEALGLGHLGMCFIQFSSFAHKNKRRKHPQWNPLFGYVVKAITYFEYSKVLDDIGERRVMIRIPLSYLEGAEVTNVEPVYFNIFVLGVGQKQRINVQPLMADELTKYFGSEQFFKDAWSGGSKSMLPSGFSDGTHPGFKGIVVNLNLSLPGAQELFTRRPVRNGTGGSFDNQMGFTFQTYNHKSSGTGYLVYKPSPIWESERNLAASKRYSGANLPWRPWKFDAEQAMDDKVGKGIGELRTDARIKALTASTLGSGGANIVAAERLREAGLNLMRATQVMLVPAIDLEPHQEEPSSASSDAEEARTEEATAGTAGNGDIEISKKGGDKKNLLARVELPGIKLDIPNPEDVLGDLRKAGSDLLDTAKYPPTKKSFSKTAGCEEREPSNGVTPSSASAKRATMLGAHLLLSSNTIVCEFLADGITRNIDFDHHRNAIRDGVKEFVRGIEQLPVKDTGLPTPELDYMIQKLHSRQMLIERANGDYGKLRSGRLSSFLILAGIVLALLAVFGFQRWRQTRLR